MNTIAYKINVYKNLLRSKTPTNAELREWLNVLALSAESQDKRLEAADQLSESYEELKEENEDLMRKVEASRLVYSSCENLRSENVRLSERADEVIRNYRSLEKELQKEREAYRDYRKSTEERITSITLELEKKDKEINSLRDEVRRGDDAFSFLEDRCSFLDAAFEKCQDEKAVLSMKAEQEISALKAKLRDEESVSDRLLQASLVEDDDVDEVFVPACFRSTK